MNGTPRSSAAPFHPDFRNVASVDGGSTTPSVSSKTATTPSGVVSISIQQVENNSQSTSSVSKTTALSSSSSDHLIQEQSTAIAAANKATRKGWLERLISFKFSSIFSFSFPSIFKSTATKQQEAIDAVLNAPDDAAKSIATGKLEKLTPGGNDAIKKTEAKRLIRAAYGKKALDSLESDPEAALADLKSAMPNYYPNRDELAEQLKDFLLNPEHHDTTEAKDARAGLLNGNYNPSSIGGEAKFQTTTTGEVAKAQHDVVTTTYKLAAVNSSPSSANRTEQINSFFNGIREQAKLPETFYTEARSYLERHNFNEAAQNSVLTAATTEAMQASGNANDKWKGWDTPGITPLE